MTLEAVLSPAIELATKGFPMYPELRRSLTVPNQPIGYAADDSKTKPREVSVAERFLNEWRSSAEIYLVNAQVPHVGQILRNSPYARTLEEIAKAEKKARKDGTKSGSTSSPRLFLSRGQ